MASSSACIIIDNNVADLVLRGTEPRFQSVFRGLYATAGLSVRMAYGGKLLREEYARSPSLLRIIIDLTRAARAIRVEDNAVDAEELRIRRSGLCVSNDVHVIALAVVAKVRLLCSDDQDLHADFKNKDLLDNPRGRVYQDPSHDHLLRECCG